MKKNPYQLNRDYIPNPANAFYSYGEDVKISESQHIQELHDYVVELEDKIAGDFEINEIIHQIKKDTFGFVRIGLIAFKIKAMKLYKNVSRTYKNFCQEYLHQSHWYVDRLIRASKVILELVAAGFEILPRCEAQCRELAACAEGDLVMAWKSVVKNISAHKITAKTIRHHLKPEAEKNAPESETIEVSQELYAAMFNAAIEAGMSIVQLLENIFQPKQNCDNWHYWQKMEAWSKDLEKIVSETDNKAHKPLFLG